MIETPRWVAVAFASVAWLVAIPFAHGVVPWAISFLTPRWGWASAGMNAASPTLWNLLGLIPVALAAVLLIWVLVVGIRQTPRRVRLELTPSFLMLGGPYAFTRNPMYVAEVGLWLGWTMYFGSIAILAASVVLWAVVNFVVVPREERTLETVFRDSYVQYKSRVPRWIGMSRR